MREVGLRVLAGEVGSEELPMIAARALAEGQDGPSLRQLAGLSRAEYLESRELLRRVVEELGLTALPGEKGAVSELVRSVARQIVTGTVAPIEGAGALAAYGPSLDWWGPLWQVAYLADLWDEDIDARAEIERGIVREAHVILAERPNEGRGTQLPLT